MEIDYEVAWQSFKALLLEKNSHGQRDLLAAMARLEVENAVPAGLASLPPRDPTHNGHSPPTRRRVGARA